MASKITSPSISQDTVHITDVELAINHFRTLRTLGASPLNNANQYALGSSLSALAEVYGLMAHFHHQTIHLDAMPTVAQAAWLAWYHTTADTPCIAICSTAQGDAMCKGCGRTEDEVKYWPTMSPCAKRHVWYRISTEGTSWRFNKYADRVHTVTPSQSAVLPAQDQDFRGTRLFSPSIHVSKRLNWTHKRTLYECSSRSKDAFCLTF